jgi:soluble lytic murein transglycosylase-like protein
MRRHRHHSADALHRAERRRERRRRRRRHVPTVMMAGAAFFSPHAGHGSASKNNNSAPAILHRDVPRGSEPLVTTAATFELSPDFEIDSIIAEASERYGVDAGLIRAVIRTESAFDITAVSTAGAQGLMQLMPALQKELGVDDPFNPRQNIMAGTQYLSALLSYFGGNVVFALASYNAGPGAVERYNGVPPYEETQKYVKTIVDLVAQGQH